MLHPSRWTPSAYILRYAGRRQTSPAMSSVHKRQAAKRFLEFEIQET